MPVLAPPRPVQKKSDAPEALSAFDEVAFDKETIPQQELDLANKYRTSLFPWRGQFSPELIEILLNKYSKSTDVILDPFAGSGTALFECARRSLTCFGSDINPAAVAMCRAVYFVNLDIQQRREKISKARLLLEKYIPHAFQIGEGMFSANTEDKQCNVLSRAMLVDLLKSASSDKFVYSLIENCLMRSQEIKRTSLDREFHLVSQIVTELPFSKMSYECFLRDARALPLPNNSIDLVITSPPYINVFNYHQNYRQMMELEGWKILEIAKSEIGSNRKNRGNRFLTVIQYALDICQCLIEMKRVLSSTGRIIIVIGRESNVRGVAFENSRIVSAIAMHSLGLELTCRQQRKFTNRFGETIMEDILHLSPNGSARDDAEDFARLVAKAALEFSINNASGDVLSDMQAAIAQVHLVRPSPFYKRSTAI